MPRPMRFPKRLAAVLAPVLSVALLGAALLPISATAATTPQELVVSGQSHVELRNFIGTVQVAEAPGRD